MSKPIVITEPKYGTIPAYLKNREITVEHDPKADELYPALGRHYVVRLDGVEIGKISGKSEGQHQKIKGSRFIRHTGYRVKWRGRPTKGRSIIANDSRAGAAIDVASQWVQERES